VIKRLAAELGFEAVLVSDYPDEDQDGPGYWRSSTDQVLVGAPEQLVDMLLEWIEVGVDGFNLAYAITPDTFVDFIDGVVPVLQQRGLMQRDYENGTFREKLFGSGRARLQAPHPAARYRRVIAGRTATPR